MSTSLPATAPRRPSAPSPATNPGASPFTRRLLAQSRIEIALLLRRGENLLFTLILPLLFLVFFSKVEVFEVAERSRPAHLMPILFAVSLMSTAFLGLSISTGFERKYAVLKRLGATPLGRPGLVWSKIVSVFAVEVIQVAALSLVGATLLGWRFEGSAFAVAAIIVVGTAAFGGLGMLIAGSLKAEGTLAVSNALYVVLILFGGVAVPLDRLPGPVATIGSWLPSAALTEGLCQAMWHGTLAIQPIIVLAAWTLVLTALAARTFRWE